MCPTISCIIRCVCLACVRSSVRTVSHTTRSWLAVSRGSVALLHSQLCLCFTHSHVYVSLTIMFMFLVGMSLLLWVCGGAASNSFLCKECGSSLSSFDNITDIIADDSEGVFRSEFIPEKYQVFYDHFPEIVPLALFVDCVDQSGEDRLVLLRQHRRKERDYSSGEEALSALLGLHVSVRSMSAVQDEDRLSLLSRAERLRAHSSSLCERNLMHSGPDGFESSLCARLLSLYALLGC